MVLVFTATHSVINAMVKTLIIVQHAQSELKSSRLIMDKLVNARKEQLQLSKDHSNVKHINATHHAELVLDHSTQIALVVLKCSNLSMDNVKLLGVTLHVSLAMELLPTTA